MLQKYKIYILAGLTTLFCNGFVVFADDFLAQATDDDTLKTKPFIYNTTKPVSKLPLPANAPALQGSSVGQDFLKSASKPTAKVKFNNHELYFSNSTSVGSNNVQINILNSSVNFNNAVNNYLTLGYNLHLNNAFNVGLQVNYGLINNSSFSNNIQLKNNSDLNIFAVLGYKAINYGNWQFSVNSKLGLKYSSYSVSYKSAEVNKIDVKPITLNKSPVITNFDDVSKDKESLLNMQAYLLGGSLEEACILNSIAYAGTESKDYFYVPEDIRWRNNGSDIGTEGTKPKLQTVFKNGKLYLKYNLNYDVPDLLQLQLQLSQNKTQQALSLLQNASKGYRVACGGYWVAKTDYKQFLLQQNNTVDLNNAVFSYGLNLQAKYNVKNWFNVFANIEYSGSLAGKSKTFAVGNSVQYQTLKQTYGITNANAPKGKDLDDTIDILKYSVKQKASNNISIGLGISKSF